MAETGLKNVINKISESITEFENNLLITIIDNTGGHDAPILTVLPDQQTTMDAAKERIRSLDPESFRKKPIVTYIDWLERLIKSSEAAYHATFFTHIEAALQHKGAAKAYRSALEALSKYPIPSASDDIWQASGPNNRNPES